MLKKNSSYRKSMMGDLSHRLTVPVVLKSSQRTDDNIVQTSDSSAKEGKAATASFCSRQWRQRWWSSRCVQWNWGMCMWRVHAAGTERTETLRMSFEDKWTSSCADTAWAHLISSSGECQSTLLGQIRCAGMRTRVCVCIGLLLIFCLCVMCAYDLLCVSHVCVCVCAWNPTGDVACLSCQARWAPNLPLS